jgi:hypothetical protein
VVLASLYSGIVPALTLAVVVPLAPLLLTLAARGEPWNTASLSTAMLRIGVFMLVARLVGRHARHEAELEQEVEVLHGFLPICMHCKSIRNEAGDWEPLEVYFTKRTDATFTHGLCRRCADVHYPDYPRASRKPDEPAPARRSSA